MAEVRDQLQEVAVGDKEVSAVRSIGERRVSIGLVAGVGLIVGALLIAVTFFVAYVIPCSAMFGCPD